MTLKVDSKNTSWPKLPKHQQHINNILSVFGKSKQSHNKGTKMQIKRAFQNYSFLSPKKKKKTDRLCIKWVRTRWGATRVRTICLLQSSCLGKFQLSMYSSFILINLTYFPCPLIYYPINSLTFQYLWSAPHANTLMFYGMIFPNRHLNVQS